MFECWDGPDLKVGNVLKILCSMRLKNLTKKIRSLKSSICSVKFLTEKFVDKMTDVSETDCSIGKMCSNQDTRVLLMRLQKKKIVTKFRGI